MKKFISTALAASVSVPNCAPCRVNSAKAASSAKERIMMSRLSDSMRRKALHVEKPLARQARRRARSGAATIARPSSMAGHFAGDRAPGDAGDAPAELQAEQDRQHDVDAVEHQLQEQAEPALAAPEHIAEDGVVDQRERRAEQPDADIGVHRRGDARLGAHEPLAGRGEQRREQRPARCRQRRAIGDGSPEHRLFLGGVAAAEGLGDETGRAGAQEIEGGEDDVEDERAGGQAAEQRGVAELADHRRVDQAEQRRRQIGERHRHGDGEHRTVGDDERSGVGWDCTLVQGIAALLIAA